MMKRLLPVFAALLASACVDDEPRYAGVDFEVESSPPAPVSIEPDRIELVAGVAVQVHVEPLSGNDLEYRDRDVVLLRARDHEVFDVYSTEDERVFVLVGVEAGETCLEIKINRREVECIDVRVLPAVSE